MPLSWERNVDAVKAMLAEIDATLPAWKNVNEQLLVLRDCNYDVNEASVLLPRCAALRVRGQSAPRLIFACWPPHAIAVSSVSGAQGALHAPTVHTRRVETVCNRGTQR